jgi:lysozyme family protein
MSDFSAAYDRYVKPIEGGYANVVGDKGGETYAGIARNFWPSWSGWPYIDAQKAGGVIKWNKKFPALDSQVRSFYQALWDRNFFGKINNQNVANILFDWFVNSGSIAIKTTPQETFGVQEILVDRFGQKISVDGGMGAQTINAINSVDNAKLYNEIKKERKIFYDWLVNRDPGQQKFYSGWIARLKTFPDVAVAAAAGLGILVLLGAGVAVFFLVKDRQKS